MREEKKKKEGAGIAVNPLKGKNWTRSFVAINGSLRGRINSVKSRVHRRNMCHVLYVLGCVYTAHRLRPPPPTPRQLYSAAYVLLTVLPYVHKPGRHISECTLACIDPQRETESAGTQRASVEMWSNTRTERVSDRVRKTSE